MTSVETFAQNISTNWQNGGIDNNLLVASWCAKAAAELTKKQTRKELIPLIPGFDAAKFSKFATIGRSPWLGNESLQAHLPPNYTILYELARTPQGVVLEAAKTGSVSPSMQRRVAVNLRISGSPQRLLSRAELEKKPNTYKIVTPLEFTNHEKLSEQLATVCRTLGCTLQLPMTKVERIERAASARYKQVEMREVRKRIKRCKDNEKRRGRPWGFFDDEIDPEFNSVEEVLTILGIEDEIPAVRRIAMSAMQDILDRMPDCIDDDSADEDKVVCFPPRASRAERLRLCRETFGAAAEGDATSSPASAPRRSKTANKHGVGRKAAKCAKRQVTLKPAGRGKE